MASASKRAEDTVIYIDSEPASVLPRGSRGISAPPRWSNQVMWLQQPDWRPMTSRCARAALVLLLVTSTTASAQGNAPAGEDVEPRTIGSSGTLLVGGAFHFDRVYSSERLLPLNFTLMGDVTKFVTPRLALRGGIVGSGSRGGDDAEERPTGVGVAALHGHGGLFFYLTPRSMWSLYVGGGYSSQLTQRDANDRGTVLGTLGLEGAISSRVHLFVDAAYGTGLSRGDENTTRLTTYAGLRLRLWR